MEGTKIEKFAIKCSNCEVNQRPQDSSLYVDWENRYYMLTCFNCNTTEAFNKFGKKVEMKKEILNLSIN